MLKTVVLKKGKEASVLRYHRWIFSGAVQRMDSGIAEGDLVQVKSHQGQYLATGFYSGGSIAVKILDFTEGPIDQGWYTRRIAEAADLRRKAGLTDNPDTNCYRLIHAEGDGIPGLIADYYNGHVVMQVHALTLYRHREFIARALEQAYPGLQTIYVKVPEKSQSNEMPSTGEWLLGQANETEVTENGIRFTVNWEKGQKTGFFLDQRDNRSLLGHYSRGKKVLNTFCYTGGFSLYALRAGAASVDSVDYSAWAIGQVTAHIERNGWSEATHAEICGDALKYLTGMSTPYEVIVLDPPAFAKSISSRHNAIQAYKRINQMALRHIAPGGILFTFSCSQVVDAYMFHQTVFSAAIEAGREVKILHTLSQPADHPVNIFHPESRYLKGLVLYVR